MFLLSRSMWRGFHANAVTSYREGHYTEQSCSCQRQPPTEPQPQDRTRKQRGEKCQHNHTPSCYTQLPAPVRRRIRFSIFSPALNAFLIRFASHFQPNVASAFLRIVFAYCDQGRILSTPKSNRVRKLHSRCPDPRGRIDRRQRALLARGCGQQGSALK